MLATVLFWKTAYRYDACWICFTFSCLHGRCNVFWTYNHLLPKRFCVSFCNPLIVSPLTALRTSWNWNVEQEKCSWRAGRSRHLVRAALSREEPIANLRMHRYLWSGGSSASALKIYGAPRFKCTEWLNFQVADFWIALLFCHSTAHRHSHISGQLRVHQSNLGHIILFSVPDTSEGIFCHCSYFPGMGPGPSVSC